MNTYIRFLSVIVMAFIFGGVVCYGAGSGIRNVYAAYLYQKYPLYYSDKISKYAEEYNLDPAFIAAVIYEESRFNSESNSSKGAIGLMQIVPETGGFIASKLGETDFTPVKLLDSETSIRYGSYYLRYLKDHYPETSEQLAAYNAGPTVVAQWKAGGDFQIKYPETAEFVARVQESQSVYQHLYFTD